MAPLDVQIRPLEGEPLGAEVLGLDLMTADLDDDLIGELRSALLAYQVWASHPT
jgi:hypothetical protein